jgi:P27 family predicted phage terminase small subunit
MKGRPKLSDAEKKAKGTLRKCRVNTSAPKSDISGTLSPSMPLDSYGKKIWARTNKFLKENNMMGDVDVDMLTTYCMEMARYIELNRMMADARKFLDKERKRMQKEGTPDGEISIYLSQFPSPFSYIKPAHECMEKALKISDRFGFTPQSRQKLKAEKQEDIKDPFLALMNPKFKGKDIAQA